ncbi:chemotaxis-specific protein-glutamate methyltransferase CheB [Desulfotomaculum defluvii]
MIKVLIVEDSPVVQCLLEHILKSDDEIKVIGTVSSGSDAVNFVKQYRPDVITVDIEMPGMDGFATTRKILEVVRVPIVIVSSHYQQDNLAMTFQALEAGAVAVEEVPPGIGHSEFAEKSKRLIQTIKSISRVKVRAKKLPLPQRTLKQEIKPENNGKRIKCIAIGASTGGPQVLKQIFSQLPGTFQVPILVVQHISTGFIKGFVDWLSQTTALPIHIASHGEYALPGHVYFAPDDFHLGIEANRRLFLSKDPPEKSTRPAVSFLFRSVSKAFGSSAVGVLLTGMGEDGAKGLKAMREREAITIAQSKESCVIFGMPGAAIKLGAAAYVLSPEEIVVTLNEIVTGLSM